MLVAISKEFQQRFIDLVDEIEEKNRAKRAAVMGISNTTYSNAYNYGIVPKITSLIRIADYFNISVDYLVGNTEDEHFAKSNNPKAFSERLEELRKSKGIPTIYELAQQTHIHRNNIAQWLKHDYFPLLDDLVLLANFFGVSMDYLLGRSDDL